MLNSRTTIVGAFALVAAHATILAIWGHAGHGPVLSSLIQIALGILCAAAAVKASRGAGIFEGRFLMLVAARYMIFTAGQSLATYYERDPTWVFEGTLPDILFHLEDVPLGIAFFLDPGRDGERLWRPHFLDLAQIGIFWIAGALYVRYLTSDSPPAVGLGAATAALVAGCFYIRALTTRSSVASAMFGRWTPAIMLSSVNNAYSGFYDSVAGTGFDMVWSLEMLVWILTTATWRPLPVQPGTGVQRAADRTVYLLPLVAACFSVVLSLGLAQRQPTMAALVVVVAVGCAVARHLGRRREQQSRSWVRTTRS